MIPELRSMVFHKPKPSPLPNIEDMLTIGFTYDGRITVGAGTDSPVRLAQRLRDLVRVLDAHPAILEEAAGVRGAAYHLAGEPLQWLDDEDAE